MERLLPPHFERKTMKQAAYDLRYLAACAVNGIMPEKEKIETMDLEKLYKMSRSHSLSALAAMTLSSGGVKISSEWKAEQDKAVRKNILFDSERAKLLQFMEQNGIWYLPMKGIILKDMYPKLGMREMADNDILFDKSRQEDVLTFMQQNGYDAASVGKGAHDTYYKPPVFNFELHTRMFAESTSEIFSTYYENIKEKLIPDEGKHYAYHMSDEDYYIHMVAHEHKHFSHSGTGLRSLIDRYVYLSKKGSALDFEYIENECMALGIAAFEKDSRTLCKKTFSDPRLPILTEKETEMLEYYMFSTTYGTMSQSIQHRIEKEYGTSNKSARFRYLMRRIFPKVDFYKDFCPVAYKYKILIPAVWFYRLVRALFKRRKQIKHEFDVVNRLK